MLKTNRNLNALTVSLLFGLLATSCGFDDGDRTLPDNDRAVRVAFRMSFAGDATRAANDGWDDYDPQDPGSQYENAINAGELQVCICDNDGRIIANVDNIVVTNTAADNQSPDYSITGTWQNAAERIGEAKKIMVFANCGPTAINADNVEQLAFERSATTNFIPMWGVASISAPLVTGKQNSIGTIDLLRSMAKVKVRLEDGMQERGYALGNISLSNYNERGYCLPKTYNTVDRTNLIRFEGSLNALASWKNNIQFTDNSTESLTLYIPEYDVKNATVERKPTVNVQLLRRGKEEGTYKLQFCNYNDGVPVEKSEFNIQRNHFYDYTVHKTNDALGISLHVREWNMRQQDLIIM